MFKNAEKLAKSASSKTASFGHFFSKYCHSRTNKDNDMKPKLVEARILNFHDLKEGH